MVAYRRSSVPKGPSGGGDDKTATQVMSSTVAIGGWRLKTRVRKTFLLHSSHEHACRWALDGVGGTK
jgi:hypothetical protein